MSEDQETVATSLGVAAALADIMLLDGAEGGDVPIYLKVWDCERQCNHYQPIGKVEWNGYRVVLSMEETQPEKTPIFVRMVSLGDI